MDHLDMLARMRSTGDGAILPNDDVAREAYPILWEMLTTRTVLDDQPRYPARVSVSVGLGCWTVGLFDETLALSIETTCRTLAECFSALEKVIPDTSSWKIQKRRKPKLKPTAEENGKVVSTKRKK